MKLVYLVGNGLDLNLGLKTMYSDFVEYYKEDSSADSVVIKFLKDLISSDQKQWSNAEEAFGQLTKVFKQNGYDAEAFSEAYEDFCYKLSEYLREEEFKLDYQNIDIAKTFVRAVSNYKKELRQQEIDEIEKDESTICGGLYFNFINFNYTYTLDHLVDEVKKNPRCLGTRNYRDISYGNSIGSVLHVHGTLDKNMVFGVNDMSQIADSTIFENYGEEYLAQLIKQRSNEIYGEYTDKKAHELLKTADIIYVYGMSLGKTDKLWWERICTIMNENPKVHLFLHMHDAPKEELFIRNFITYAERVKKQFLAYTDISEENKKRIAKRIHVVRANIFEEFKDSVK